MGERHGRVLAELAELGLGLARDLAALAGKAQTEEHAQGFALAFHRVSRSVRLCLALESRLERERREAMREHDNIARRAVETRKAQVRIAIEREVCAEYETDEADRIFEDFDERLDEEALYERFLQGPPEAAIARIRKDLGLPLREVSSAPFPLEGVGDGGGGASATTAAQASSP